MPQNLADIIARFDTELVKEFCKAAARAGIIETNEKLKEGESVHREFRFSPVEHRYVEVMASRKKLVLGPQPRNSKVTMDRATLREFIDYLESLWERMDG